MNTLDVLIGIVLAGGLLIGLRSGFIKQALSFAGMIVAFLLALNLMHAAGALVTTSLGISEDIAPLLGFALVFLAVQVLVFALARLVETVAGALKLSGVNRLLGGAVGAFKAALLLSVAFLVLARLQVPTEETRDASALYDPVASVLPAAWDYFSEVFPEVERLSDRFGEGLPPPPHSGESGSTVE